MTASPESTNLPAQIADAITWIPKALVPASVKALDRLVGAAVDLPVAWFAQQKAKIDAQTQAYTAVEAAIAKAVASEAGADPDTVQRAFAVLVRKSYRKHNNRVAVGAAMVDDLRERAETQSQPEPTQAAPPDIDEDWLNVFERYAEDASTDRMQKLWGRVLSGEVRRPGQFSMRTLRFLSEFSQADALLFASFCENAFQSVAPKTLVNPDGMGDMSHLFMLESSGLIHGADGMGLTQTMTFDANGSMFLREGDLVIFLKGDPGTQTSYSILGLTSMGQELVSLIPNRDALSAARKVAHAIKMPEMKSAYIGHVTNAAGNVQPLEILWQANGVEPAIA